YRYKSTVWATWDPSAPPFLEYLGDFVHYLDLTLDSWDGSEGGSEVLAGVQKWLIPCNWKFPAENFSGDSYHNISHRSVDLVGIGPSGSGRRDMRERQMARRLQICFPERGHQTGVYALPKGEVIPAAYRHSSVVSEYFAHCEDERRRRLGEWGRVTGSPGEVFPNTALHPRQPRTIAVWHPRGAHQTEVWRWYLVDAAAPAEVKSFLRDYYIRYSGPAGLTEQDDMENWNYAHAASRGTIARLAPYVKYGASKARTFGAATAMAEVEIYATMFCPYCSRARALLERKGVGYKEIDIIEEPRRRDEMIRRAGGRTTVPQIFINGEHIGGCDEMVALDRAGGLDPKLGIGV